MKPVLFILTLLSACLFSIIPSSSAFVAKIDYKTAQRSVRRMTATTSESPPKFHHFTVCLVPSEREEHIWQILTRARTELRDAGFYRWPPHVNLLYPFCDPYVVTNDPRDSAVLDSDILRRLEAACRQVEPFQVQLNQFGTFGGSNRGVLWLDPSSSSESTDAENASIKEVPVIRLQRLLEEQFPFCNEQRLVGEDGGFKPHMTLSHFASRSEAQAAQNRLSSTAWWPKDDSLQFWVEEIYLMHRQGDVGGGQFKRIASLPLGENRITQIMEGPFQQMPTVEYEWVKEARKIMKRERNRRVRQRRSRGRRSPSPRVQDTPESIAAKRAERKAKGESLEPIQ
jgi:2'-5' RNA ligase